MTRWSLVPRWLGAWAALLLFTITSPPGAAQPATAQLSADGARADALGFEALVNRVYAYPERLPGGTYRLTPRLREEAERVTDRRALLRFAERALLLLADHHAITGASFGDSWAVVPSFADLWIERTGNAFVIEAVREGSPAAQAGIRPGARLLAVDGVPIGRAVADFWADLGAPSLAERAAFAARILAAGRRDRPRRLTVADSAGRSREITLPSLYANQHPQRSPVDVAPEGRALRIRINDALGDTATIAAFDAAMHRAAPGQPIIIDLTDTPSGGNTVVARAILGWFVDRARAYQMHNLPVEERQTGVPRQWLEQVLPRRGMHHRGRVEVRVGRWTGSMGEGLAIGFDAIGADVRGTRMAGLPGAIYDHALPNSGLVVKLPTERLMTVRGQPREAFVPRPIRSR